MSNDDNGGCLISYLNNINICEICKSINKITDDETKDFFREGREEVLDQFTMAVALVCDNAAGLGYGVSNAIKIIKLDNERKATEEINEIVERPEGSEKVREVVLTYLNGDEDVIWNVAVKLFHGSGHMDMKEENPILTSFYVVWAIGIRGMATHGHIKTVLGQVIIDFLNKCFLDPKEIIEIGHNDSSEQKIREYADRINYDIKRAYIEQIAKKYGVDVISCTNISLCPYEKRACYGKILFLPADKVDELNSTVIRFKGENTKRELSDISGTRKFLEACGDGFLLVEKDVHHLLGIIAGNEENKNLMQEYPYVKFNGNAKWELIDQDRTVLCYELGNYYANRKEIAKNYQAQLEDREIPDLGKLLATLEKTSHGAIVIMSEDASQEAVRLAKVNRAINLIKFRINNDGDYQLLGGLLNVDGAVLMDYNMNCYAFGTILDGEAKIKGLEKRGARYNSSKNYVAGKNRVAFVVSEDKMRGVEIIDGQKIKIEIL